MDEIEGSVVEIEFIQDEASEWRAADLLPREACVIGKDLYIKIGIGPNTDVELHVQDRNRMARGKDGAARKKHFFFHVNTASIVALPGETKVVPHRAKFSVFERVTFTPRSTVPYDRDNYPLCVDGIEVKENWNQEVTDAD